MKKMLFAAALLMTVSVVSFAQEKPAKKEKEKPAKAAPAAATTKAAPADTTKKAPAHKAEAKKKAPGKA